MNNVDKITKQFWNWYKAEALKNSPIEELPPYNELHPTQQLCMKIAMQKVIQKYGREGIIK